MTTDELEPLLPDLEEARSRSLTDDVRGLAERARTFAEAELAFQKSRASFAGQEVKATAVLGVIAVVLVFFALMGLVFGLILALAPLVTAWGSTALVCGALLIAALVCALRARSRWRQAAGTLTGAAAGQGG